MGFAVRFLGHLAGLKVQMCLVEEQRLVMNILTPTI